MTAFQNAYSKGLAFDRARLTRRSGGLNHAVGVVACQTGVRRRPTVPTPRETVPNNTSRPEMGGRKYQPGAPDELPPHMSPGRKQAAAPRFLNVDLEVRSRKSLAPLAAELDRKTVVLHCERVRSAWFLRVESRRSYRGPDATIRALCKLVEGLSEPGKQLWRSAFRRTFDIGYAAHSDAAVCSAAIKPETLRMVAQLGAELVVTIYPPELPGASSSTAPA